MALCVEIADALVTLIEGTTFYDDVTVERQWLETQRLEKLQVDDPIRVIVVPRTLSVTAFDLRPRNEFAWDIGIWIDKAIDQNNESIDPVADFVEEVISLIASNRMLAIPSPPFRANCIGISQDPTYDPTQLLDIQVFRSVFIVTYRVTK